MAFLLLAACGLLSLGAASTPSPQTLGSISILAANSLDISDAETTSAALLLESSCEFAAAREACIDLGEKLWTPSHESFNAGLNQSLAYEVFAGRIPSDQLFWIHKSSSYRYGADCRAMGVDGKIHTVGCHKTLPTLCTQSAPASNNTYADTSAKFQVAQSVGNQVLVGYRDFQAFRYLGVRFAQEPKPFTYSKLYRGTGTNDALEGAPECLQMPTAGSSTDCLFLNLWTTSLPGGKPEKKSLKPVMVYIYGGGFTTGSASNPNQDGGNLASRGDVVVVAISYRLSTLGFLPFKDGKHNGNYWLSDLIAGLEWIQDYVEDFGGDPSHVTIFGESAGALSVQKLIESPEAAGLFHGAILQSDYKTPNAKIADAYEETTVPILSETGCDSASNQVACLQAYDPVKLLALKTISNGPVIDGKYLRSSFLGFADSYEDWKPNYVPTMIGVNRDEGGVLGPFFQTDKLKTGIRDLAKTDGLDAQAIIDSGDFPRGHGPTPSNQTLNVFNTTTRIYTDNSFRCVSQAIAYGGAKSGKIPAVYFYEFNRTYQDPGYDIYDVCQPPPSAAHPAGDPSNEYFKCHAGDLFFTFGTVTRSGLPLRDAQDNPFQQLMTDYWTSFGRTFNPNPDMDYLVARGYWETIGQIGYAGTWPNVDAKSPSLMALQWNPFVTTFRDDAQCAVIGLPVDYLLK